jgi:hypothetical protein
MPGTYAPDRCAYCRPGNDANYFLHSLLVIQISLSFKRAAFGGVASDFTTPLFDAGHVFGGVALVMAYVRLHTQLIPLFV